MHKDETEEQKKKMFYKGGVRKLDQELANQIFYQRSNQITFDRR